MRNTSDLLQTIATWYYSQDRKAKGDFHRKAGIDPKSVTDAFKGVRCSAATAIAIAQAYGCPKKWAELVIIRNER